MKWSGKEPHFRFNISLRSDWLADDKSDVTRHIIALRPVNKWRLLAEDGETSPAD